MAFKSPFTFETNEQEAARLAQSHPTSINGRLAPLPVTIEHVRRGQIIELPRAEMYPEDPARIIMLVDQVRRSKHEYAPDEPRRRDHGWTCIVVASTDPVYPVGGHDLVIGEAELRRGRLVTEQTLLDTADLQAAP